MTPKRYFTTEGKPFPATVLDARAGVPTGREGFWQLAEERERVETLDAELFEMVRENAQTGEQQMLAGDHETAWDCFVSALDFLPEPRHRWNAAGWLLVALGENSVRAGDYRAAADPLQDALRCPGGLANPWVHLRLGQTFFELGNREVAAEHLARAYMCGGRDVFAGQDGKYFALVEKVLQPPPGKDRLE